MDLNKNIYNILYGKILNTTSTKDSVILSLSRGTYTHPVSDIVDSYALAYHSLHVDKYGPTT